MTYPDEAAREEAWQRAERDREWHEPACAICGEPRNHHGAWPTYLATYRGERYDLGHGFEEGCPNIEHPLLCSVDPDTGEFVPECGCPVHDGGAA